MKKTDILAAASLANVSFAYEWSALLNRSEDFYRKVPPTRNLIILTFCVALVTLGVLVIRWLITLRPRVHAWLWWLPWLPMAIPLNLWSKRLGVAFPEFATAAQAGMMGAVIVIVILSAIGFRERIETVFRSGILLISPLLLLTLSEAFVLPLFARRQPTTISVSRNEELKGSPGRVLLMIFDEMDQVKAFNERPADVHLKHFDELRQESIYAENAYSPATDTILSVPSYLFGQRVSRVETKGFNEAIWRAMDTDETFDTKYPNLFASASSLGVRTAVIGWYLPYCRIFSGPTYCSWEMGFRQALEHGLPTGALMLRQFGHAASDLPAAEKLRLDPAQERQSHIQAYQSVLSDAKSKVANPNFDFVYVHFPVPHWPVIFDRHTGTWTNRESTDYFSSLVLADKTLGEIQSILEAAGMWDRTTVLVVGDHGQVVRPKEEDGVDKRRVPFLLKLSGQKECLDFHPDFDTVILHNLVLMMLQKSLTAHETVDWLMQHRRSPNPLPKVRN